MLPAVETTAGIMIEAIVEAFAAADATVVTDFIVVKVSGSSLSQIGPVQFRQLTGQPSNQLSYIKVSENLIYFHRYGGRR